MDLAGVPGSMDRINISDSDSDSDSEPYSYVYANTHQTRYSNRNIGHYNAGLV